MTEPGTGQGGQRCLRPEDGGVVLAAGTLDGARAAARAAALAWHDLDLAPVTNKQELLQACARLLGFPRFFGANWDALADCLKDLSVEAVLSLRNCGAFAARAPADYATALEVFEDAADYWRSRGRLFLVVVDVEPAGVRLRRFPGRGSGC